MVGFAFTHISTHIFKINCMRLSHCIPKLLWGIDRAQQTAVRIVHEQNETLSFTKYKQSVLISPLKLERKPSVLPPDHSDHYWIWR